MQFLIYNLYFLAEPETWGDWSCSLADRIGGTLPDTPFSLASLSIQFANNVPQIGSGLIYSVSQDLSTVLSLVVVYKILKLRFWSL